MLGHLCQLISKRSSTDDVSFRPVLARHYKLCCCGNKHYVTISKSGRPCHDVCCILCDFNFFIVVIRSCKNALYIIVIGLYNQFYVFFCFQLSLVYSSEFRKHEIALLPVFQNKKFTPNHVLSCHLKTAHECKKELGPLFTIADLASSDDHEWTINSHFINPVALRMTKSFWSFGHSECSRVKENQFNVSNKVYVSNKLNVTNHVQIHTCETKIEENFSIGHCFCEKDTVSTINCWCKSKSKALKCHWLHFSTLTFVLLDINTYRNFKYSCCLSPVN